ncbi:MAG: acid phosphatase [Gammaproteobacteria bacterium]|nr:alkaline phosphatase family protein [Gammaproteobacteria bacterium]MDE1984223.1 acid phosphatase [Gammaproteobacteria bacterium]MDE2108809.1 acid phosphatase [Gammaproteobacteria bacterium]MDE2461923.1 acid phosphatase [Gammaproteobacteria bacterium]
MMVRARIASLPFGLILLLGLFLIVPTPGAQAARATAHWRPAHVVIVIEENKSFSTIIGNHDAPYLNQLAKQGLLFTNAHAVIHPSQPNYVALFAGSTYGLTDDSCPRDLSGPNLASELLARKLSFAEYSEDMPAAGYTGCSGSNGLYRRKHDPVADFQAGLPASANLPFSDFPDDYSKLPTVAFVIPNMMNDMHDGTIAGGDVWLKQHLSKYAEWAKSHNSLLIVTWDESDARSVTNQIPLIVVGARVKPGRSGQYVDHYALLRALLNMYGLPLLAHASGARAAEFF